MADRQFLLQLSKRLADDGKLIEAGFLSLRAAAMAHDAPPIQVEEMKMAFMAGAQHLFASIMTILDPGVEETLDDLRRMSLIAKELEDFGKVLELRVGSQRGAAEPRTGGDCHREK